MCVSLEAIKASHVPKKCLEAPFTFLFQLVCIVTRTHLFILGEKKCVTSFQVLELTNNNNKPRHHMGTKLS